MRVVLDTNILISALLIQVGHPAVIYRAWQQGAFTLLVCAEQLDELRATLRKPAISARIKPHNAGRLVSAARAWLLRSFQESVVAEWMISTSGSKGEAISLLQLSFSGFGGPYTVASIFNQRALFEVKPMPPGEGILGTLGPPLAVPNAKRLC
jgi:hypothetical protein